MSPLSATPSSPQSRTVSDSPQRHLYVVLHRSDDHSYSIHKIDLANISSSSSSSNEPFDFPKPIFTLPRKTYPSPMGFLASGSKIYMFGGGTPRPFLDIAATDTNLHGAACFVFETSPERDHYNQILELHRLNWGKFSPIVLGPLQGKFYSCSRNLAYRDIEEFDTETESWKPLPPPPVVNSGKGFYDPFGEYLVHTNAVAGNRLVFITMKGIFAYHVVKQTWECLCCSGGGGVDLKRLCPYSGEPLSFDYSSYDVRGGLQHAEVNVEEDRSKFIWNPLRACSEHSDGEVLEHRLDHNVVRLEEENKVCVISLGVRALKLYVGFQLCSVSPKSDGNPRVLEENYVAYAVEETWDKISGIAACFVCENQNDDQFGWCMVATPTESDAELDCTG